MKKWLVMAAALAVSTTGFAAGLAQDSSEASILGMRTAKSSMNSVRLCYSRFLADYFSVGAQAAYRKSSDETMETLGVRAEYNVDLGYVVVPFVAGVLSVANTSISMDDQDDPGVCGIAEGNIGVKVMVTETVAISAAFVAECANEAAFDAGDGTLQKTNLSGELGVRFFF